MIGIRQLASGTWYKQTREEKTSYRNAIGLFFGALLGANLGTLTGLSLGDYLTVVATLAMSVMGLQVISAARSRRYALGTLSAYAALLAVGYGNGSLRPPGLAPADFDKIAATLALWLLLTAIVECTPTIAEEHPVGPR